MTTTSDTTGAALPLADRALRAFRHHRDTDPDGFADRHADWPQWTRRAAHARAITATLGVPAWQVTVTDDPDRTYGPVPGDLITVTDHGRTWRLIPDLTAPPGHGWLLLDTCTCDAQVPVARIATLADLGDYLDEPLEHVPDECHGDPAHRGDCPMSPLPTDLPPERQPDH